MSPTTDGLDRTEDDILTPMLSDEALEVAAGMERATSIQIPGSYAPVCVTRRTDV